MSEYTGKVIDVAIWEHELTLEEIHSLANGANKQSQDLLAQAHRVWDDVNRAFRIPPHMLGIPNRRREAVMATRKKHGR